ncbi:tyrosine-type recombinase/integrase [Rhodococcus oxybenzonivorans]|uniref:tyrosine-type recombinase/integrase n=2 Tax=Rhodococcus oxybenzonivorans TaxID=1990687 RepID=UPI001E5A75AE|nr:site-specific integrase [Rhodococcus oxybenzonivorans]
MVTLPLRLTGDGSVESPVPSEHVGRATYREWLWRHVPTNQKYSRLYAYDDFVELWPSLADWFAAPLSKRMFDTENPVPGRNPHGGASVIMPYLSYLSLVHGIRLDYDLLFARTFASPFTASARTAGLGIDPDTFERYVSRLVQLGYSTQGALTALKWSFGRMLLHRGNPDMTALTMADVCELRCAADSFADRLWVEPVREFYSRSRGKRPSTDPAETFRRSATARINGAHLLLFTIGQVDAAPPGRVDAGSWTSRLAPAGTPPKMTAVIERYLRLHLDANLGREQSVRHFRDALRRLVLWLREAHPEITSFDQLDRKHAEEFLRWLGEQTSEHTGMPLALTTRRSIVTLLARFVNETAAWGWDDVPGRVLFTRGDIPKIARTVPRFIPDHELTALMSAIDQLPDQYQRAALIIARWSGARRDEIRRLAIDCLDAYPDGHPRLRIPVGKGYTERMIPLHPDAAAALRPLIELARTRRARGRFDPSVGRSVEHVFTVRGKLLSKGFLFDLALKTACTTAGLLDSQGRPTISAHRFRHTIGTQLAEGGARLQTIMAVLGHRTPHMSLIYASLSDPTVKQQYQAALDRHLDGVTLAGPAAQALREHRLDPQAVSWLQTNFLKTELELGHCLRLPQEGPCECDLVLTCSKFLTTSDYAPRLRQRLTTEQTLIGDAVERGWDHEVERHQRTADRIKALLSDLGEERQH